MNEQFKLLAEQAQIGLFEDKSFGWSVIAGTDQHLSKFGELIVRECIDIVKNTPKHCAYTTHDIGAVDCTILKSVQSIEQHFNLKHEYK